jgi:hypothetical protein
MLNEDDVFTSYIDIFESAGISAALVVPDPTNADPNLLDVPFINGKTKYNKSYRGNYLLYTTNLYIENSLSPITATLESRGCKIKVYLNRAEVQPSNFVYDVYEKRDYSYQFVPGWNTLQFVIYKHVNDDANPQTNPKSEPLYVHPHLDQVLAPFLNNDKAKIRAEVFPLTKVSQYDLENNVLACDQTKFATERVVQDVDGYANLIVNHDPLNFNGYNGTGHPNFRVKYLLDYQFNPDSSKVKGARMMAVLKGSNSSDAVTPKLLGYRIKAL